jgi:ribonucleoside-triphosphate reductase
VFKKIKKRDGRVVNFNTQKITDAIAKAGEATNEFDTEIAQKLTLKVLNLAQQAISQDLYYLSGSACPNQRNYCQG